MSINIPITADPSSATSAIRQVTDKIESLKKATKSTADSTKDLNKALRESAGTWRDMTIGRIADGAKAINKNFAMATTQLTMAGYALKKFVDIGAEHERYTDQLKAMQMHKDWEDFNTQLQNAVTNLRGVATYKQLLPSLSKGVALGLNMANGNFEKMAILAEKASIAMGTKATDAMEKFMIAAGRQSSKVADDLGVLVSITEANEEYAEKIGVATSALTKQQQQTAFLETMVRKLEESYSHIDLKEFESTAQRANTRIEKMIERLEEMAGIGAVAFENTASFFEEYGGKALFWILETDNATQAYKREITDLGERLKKLDPKGYERIARSGLEASDMFEKMKKRVADLTTQQAEYNKEMVKTNILLGGVSTSIRGSLQEVEGHGIFGLPAGLAKSQSKTGEWLEKTAQSRKAYRERMAQEAIERAKAIALAEDKLLMMQSTNADSKAIKDQEREVAKLKARTDREKVWIDVLADMEDRETKLREAEEKKRTKITEEQSKLKIMQSSNLYTEQELMEQQYVVKKLQAKDAEERELLNIQKEYGLREIDRELELAQLKKDIDTDLYSHRLQQEQLLFSEKSKLAQMELREREQMQGYLVQIYASAIDSLVNMDEKRVLSTVAGIVGSIGQQMVAEGVKNWWSGMAYNATPFSFGLGTPLMGIGIKQIGIGTGLMVGSGLAKKSLASTGGGTSGGAAQERNAVQKGGPVLVNVKTSLFGNQTEAQLNLQKMGVGVNY